MNRIAKLRKEQGLTQRDLSELTGIPLSTLCKYEQDVFDMKNMPLSTACLLAQMLNCKVYDLL